MEESGEKTAKIAAPVSLRQTATSSLLARWISSKHSKQNENKIEDCSTKYECKPSGSIELPMEGYYISTGELSCSTEIDCSFQLINEDFIKNILVEHARKMYCRSQLYENLEELSKTDESNIESFLAPCKPHELNVLLLYASYLGRADLIRRLCEHEVNVNYAEPDQSLSALHLCAFRNCLDGVQHLIARGARVSVNEKHTPFYYAVLGDSYDVVHFFVQQDISQESSKDEKMVLHVAARTNAHRVLSLLATNNKELERLDLDGFAAIHHAADAGNSNCLHVLLDAGCPVDLPTRKNDTALHLAAKAGCKDSVALLVKAKANLQLKNHRGHTALHLVARSHNLECVKILLESGADPNAEDENGCSSLHLALSQTLMTDNIIQLLLTWRANVNKADKCGYTPLHVAASNELSQCVNLLIMHDADLSAKTNSGISALSIVLRNIPTCLDIFEQKLDASLTLHKQEFVKSKLELQLDFRLLLQHQQHDKSCYLDNFVKEGYEEILAHPLCQSFLHLKWQQMRKYYIIRLLFYLVYMLVFTNWIMMNMSLRCYYWSHNIQRPSLYSNSTFWFYNFFCTHPTVLNIHWYILIVLTMVETYRSFAVMPNYLTRQFFTQMEYLMNWFVLLTVFTNSFVYSNDTFYWQRFFGALAVLCGWSKLMLMMGQLPMFGLYIAMFTSVQAKFFKLLLTYSCLLIGFTASLLILFPYYIWLHNPFIVLGKVLSMMAGELDSDFLFKSYQISVSFEGIELKDITSQTLLNICTQLFFMLLVVFLTIVLLNLLIGIAVNDIKDLQKSANLVKLVRQTKLIYDMEVSWFFAFLPNYMLKCLQCLMLVRPLPLSTVLTVNPLNPREKRLPRDILSAAYHIAKEGKGCNNFATSRKKTYRLGYYVRKAMKGATCTGCSQRDFHEDTQNCNKSKDDIAELRKICEKYQSLLQEFAKTRDANK